MSYQDFLAGFAKVQRVGSVALLLEQHAKRYSFQINSRDRAKEMITKLENELKLTWKGKKLLDVGCAYGSLTIELAKLGAASIGVDSSEKWLDLAKLNAQNEVDVPFINCDASSYKARQLLLPYGPFDLVVVYDVFEHIYDTPGLLDNIRRLIAPNGLIYFKVPNGKATRHVLLEGHKGKFGISLLAPDYWGKFVKAPFNIYYRRWEYFSALFREYEFFDLRLLNTNTDPSIAMTKKHIARDMHKIKQTLKASNFENVDQFKSVRSVCHQYFEEINDDLERMSWDELFFKYRVTFWEGLVHAS